MPVAFPQKVEKRAGTRQKPPARGKKQKEAPHKEQTKENPPPPAEFKKCKRKPPAHPDPSAVIPPEDQIDVDEEYENEPVVERRARISEEEMPPVFPFNIYDMGLDYTYGFFGKRREGKSFLMRFLMYHMKEEFPRVYVFSNTLMNGFWQRCVPQGKCFKGYMPGVLAAILEEQENFIKEQEGLPEDERANTRLMIILDDCISQDLHHDPVLKNIFFNGRHLKICLMISMQYARGIPPGQCRPLPDTFSA